jgi:hypothetical protein
MPWEQGTTVQEAREAIARFLRNSGCYDICARCPVYPGGEGCCHGCPSLMRGAEKQVLGCGSPVVGQFEVLAPATQAKIERT